MGEIVNNAISQITHEPEISMEGTFLAYTILVVMALFSIYRGSFRSVDFITRQKKSGKRPETMFRKDVKMLLACIALVFLHIFSMLFLEEIVKSLLASVLLVVYFVALGVACVAALSRVVRSIFIPFIPIRARSFQINNHFLYTKTTASGQREVVGFKFSAIDVAIFAVSSVVGGLYLYSQNWLTNDIFGLAFVVDWIEILHINNLKIGCTLLGVFFLYDIILMFGTDVMVTIAKALFEAPVKLIFPQDIFANMYWGHYYYATLGLGDIVIPGIFIAMLLRFDISLNRKKCVYFYTSLIAYFGGLVATIVCMFFYKQAQPAMSYVVPMCIFIPVLTAFIKGDFGELLKFEDYPEETVERKEK